MVQHDNFIVVRHEVQLAHRLMNLPGKCQKIHGHSMLVEMRLHGDLNENGIMADLDFGSIKKAFRSYLDTAYDHRLLLNEEDPWATFLCPRNVEESLSAPWAKQPAKLPGLMEVPGDPTTENLAKWICEWGWEEFVAQDGRVRKIRIDISETGTNGASFALSKE
jgi:6-pyruvoyltetrahydropterin/6-carboxytetrahydropterin synthase